MSITLICAVGKNNVIGVDNDLPWHLPKDLQHFKQLTLGKTVVMGRKTWESIPEKFRPLPQRTNVVITRNPDFCVPEGVFCHDSLTKALYEHKNEDIFIIGGGTLYAQTIDIADTLEITHVDQSPEGSVSFPEIDTSIWKITKKEDFDGFSFVTYTRYVHHD